MRSFINLIFIRFFL